MQGCVVLGEGSGVEWSWVGRVCACFVIDLWFSIMRILKHLP